MLVELKEPPQMKTFLDFGKIDKSFIYLFLIRLIFEKDNAELNVRQKTLKRLNSTKTKIMKKKNGRTGINFFFLRNKLPA